MQATPKSSSAPHPIIGETNKPAPVEQEKEAKRLLMRDLGRKLSETIETFFNDKVKPADLMVIYGGIDYVIRLHKERRNALAVDFLKMKSAVDQLGLKVHEPFENDNVPVAPDYFEGEPKQ